jgi:hypothetical protein
VGQFPIIFLHPRHQDSAQQFFDHNNCFKMANLLVRQRYYTRDDYNIVGIRICKVSKLGSGAVAMVRETRSGTAWLGYVSLRLFSFLLAIAAAGAAYQWFENSRDRHKYPAPGQLVDVGGYRMHLYCFGMGSPTVVLDSGLSDSYLSWYKVQPEVAQFTRVCSYDRAGL